MFFLASSVVTITALAQDVDTLVVSTAPAATFSDARSIAVDFNGRIYIVDAARSMIFIHDTDGKFIASFGGPGTDEGQFDEPVDIDPTTSLLLNVADAGNSRIQRFTHDFRFIENLPVPSQTGSSGDESPSFRPGAGRVVTPADGFPIAVVSSRTDDLYVIEDVSQRVLRWDRDRRNRWEIGQNLNLAENVADPIDLAIAGDVLLVADRGREAILVYDLFGFFIRAMAETQLKNIMAVKVDRDKIFAILPTRIIRFDMRGRLEQTVHLVMPENETLVDAAARNDLVYLLTHRSLYIVPLSRTISN